MPIIRLSTLWKRLMPLAVVTLVGAGCGAGVPPGSPEEEEGLLAPTSPPSAGAPGVLTASVSDTVDGSARGYLVTPQELRALKAKALAGTQPYKTAREEIIQDANGGGSGNASYWPYSNPSGNITDAACGSDTGNPSNVFKAAELAYAKALAYHLTDNTTYASVVRAELLDLTDTTGFGGETYSGDNQCILNIAVHIPVWIQAADLLEDYPGWSGADKQKFQSWLRDHIYKKAAWASNTRRNNWGAMGSSAAVAIADYLGDTDWTLTEVKPTARTLSVAQAFQNHRRMQFERVNTAWKGDSHCTLWGIRSHGGFPDELRRGSSGCTATSIKDADASKAYTEMISEAFVYSAELLLRRGDASLYDNLNADGTGSIKKLIRFEIANPTKSWKWATHNKSTMMVAYRYYRDPAMKTELEYYPYTKAGTAVLYAKLTHQFASNENPGPPPTVPPPGGSVSPPPPPAQPPTPTQSAAQLGVVALTASGDDGEGSVAAQAQDEDLATRWSAEGSGQWLSLDLGSSRSIGSVDIAWYLGNTRQSAFDLQLSQDGTSWTTVFSGQSSGTTTQPQNVPFPDAMGRFVRILGRGNTQNAWNSVTEVIVYEGASTSVERPVPTRGEPQLAISGVTASTHDGNVPGNTRDADLNTRWSAEGNGQWLRVDLGSVRDVGSMDVAWYNGDQRRASFSVEVSTDGSTWTPVFSGQSSGSTRQMENVDFPDAAARYVRVVGQGNDVNTWNSITELVLYQGSVAATFLVKESFDTLTSGAAPADWTVTGSGTSITVVDQPSAANRSLKVYDASSSTNIQAQKGFTATSGQLILEYTFLQPTAMDWFGVWLRSGGTSVIELYTTAEGKLMARDAAGTDTGVGGFTANTWTTVKVVVDTNLRLYDVYLGGELQEQGISFRANASTLDNVLVRSGNSYMGTAFVDDIQVRRP